MILEKLLKFIDGYKTQSTIALWMVVETYLRSKGIDIDSIKEWAMQTLTSLDGIYLLFGSAAIWFRQLGKKKEV